MMIDDHREIDEYFNEDIFCDLCSSMWPEVMYLEHWAICRNNKVVKKQQEKKLEQELRAQAAIQRKEREGREERERKHKSTGRRRFFDISLVSQVQNEIKPEPGITVNTQRREETLSMHSSSSRRSQRIAEPTRNGNLVQCMGCGRQMTQLQFGLHPAFCQFPTGRCPYCSSYFLEQLLPLHKLNCPRNNGSQPQQPPQPQPQPSPPQVESQYNFGNYNLTPQALEMMQRLWSEAKNKGKGLKQEQIKMFESQKYKKREGEQEADNCTVCMDQIQDGGDFISLPCRHVFHSNCIKQWIKRIAQCPNCKYNIKENFVVKQ